MTPPAATQPGAGDRRPRTVRIGLTGPIGCGKSTVAGWLAELGATVIDADRIARGVTPPGSPELAAIVEAFGSGVIAADGTLDRAALGQIVFSDRAALRRLEAIIHPAVRPRIVVAIASAETNGAPAVVIEAIKLVEGGLAALCDEVWLLECSPGAQADRLAERGMAEADAGSRIAAQSDLVERLAASATRRLDTSGTAAETRALIESAYREALAQGR